MNTYFNVTPNDTVKYNMFSISRKAINFFLNSASVPWVTFQKLLDEGLLQFHANSRFVLLTISAEIITDRS